MNKKEMAALAAAKYIKEGMVIGIGTGSTVFFLIEEIARLINSGMNLRCVATSKNTEEIARKLGIKISKIDEFETIDLAIDGVDQIDGNFDAIKGGGGALFREKIVAKIAREVIWIMDDSKQVEDLRDYLLPIEVLPFGVNHLIRKLNKMNIHASLRVRDGEAFITDNNNYILDLQIERDLDINESIAKINKIVGVIEVGYFPNYCDWLVIGTYQGPQILENNLKYKKK